jgi:multidrug efflux pump subunit AcrB
LNKNPVIAFSCKHPVSVLSILLAVVVLSCISLKTIGQNYLPKTGDRYLLVSTEFEGVSAEQMRKLVTVVVEDAVASLKGVKNISSTTRDGLSLICLELHWNTDSALALSQCRSLLDSAYSLLPSDCKKSEVRFFDAGTSAGFTVLMRPKDDDLTYARYLADKDIKGILQRINGIASVKVGGGVKEEVHVVVDKTKSESLKMPLEGVAQVLSSANFDYPAGNITEGNRETLFKTHALFESLDQIESCPLVYAETGLVKLSDIARVEKGFEEQKSFFMFNGKEAICFDLYKKADDSPIALSREIKRHLQKLNSMYRDNFEFSLIRDTSTDLKESLFQLALSVAAGVLITIIVLLIFFRSVPHALLAGSIIPLTMLFSVFVLNVSGRTINILSVSGIAVGIGMVIDSTLVTIENVISRRNEARRTGAGQAGQTKIEDLVASAVTEVSLSSVGSTLTTIVVFIPMFFLPGLIGKLFFDLSLAVVSSIGFSCVLSVFYVSAVLTILYKSKRGLNVKILDTSGIQLFYKKILGRVFRSRLIIPLIFAACIVVGALCIKTLPKEIMSATSGNYVEAKVLYPAGTSLSRMNADSTLLTGLLLQEKQIQEVSVYGGLEKDDYESLFDIQNNEQMLFVLVKTGNQKQAVQTLAAIFAQCGLDYEIQNQKSMLENLLDFDENLFIVTAEDNRKIEELIESGKDGYKTVLPNLSVNEYEFKVDRFACARFGVSAVQVASACRNALEGVYSSPLYREGREIPILVKFADGQIGDTADLSTVRIAVENDFVQLGSLGSVENKVNTKIFYRYNRKDAKKVALKEGAVLEGDYVNPASLEFDELMHSAVFILIVVVLLLYCVMGAQFESFLIPLLMIAALPPAFSGAFLALKIAGQSLNINSVISLVVLFGTSVNNSIILYESIKGAKKIDRESVIDNSVRKLQSVLITSLTSILALIPFAIDPLHKMSQQSMAVAIIGGLLLSLVVVLLVVPVILKKCLEVRE